MMKTQPAQQQSLLQLSEADAEIGRLTHRAAHLPEQQRYDAAVSAQRETADRVAVLGIACEDLDAQVARLESEVDGVRKREDRDRGLLDAGSVNPKQLEELQHELGTLQRRQASLEDTLLEVMERREQMVAEQVAAQAAADAADTEVDAALVAREEALAGIEQARAELSARRDGLVSGLDAELVGLYEQQRASSGIGAGLLQGGRCGACRIELDRGEIGRITAAPSDEVLRCPECRAILVRP